MAVKKHAVEAKPEAVETKSPRYFMAPGCAVTSKKGILSGDTKDEVKVEYLHGGKAALEAFVESGHIVKE